MSDWKNLEQTAERLKRLSENTNFSYSEREKLRRDAERVRREAKKQRDAYVNWLWGH